MKQKYKKVNLSSNQEKQINAKTTNELEKEVKKDASSSHQLNEEKSQVLSMQVKIKRLYMIHTQTKTEI